MTRPTATEPPNLQPPPCMAKLLRQMVTDAHLDMDLVMRRSLAGQYVVGIILGSAPPREVSVALSPQVERTGVVHGWQLVLYGVHKALRELRITPVLCLTCKRAGRRRCTCFDVPPTGPSDGDGAA